MATVKSNRKWRLVLMVLFITTGILLLPVILSLFGIKIPAVITGVEYVSVVTLVVSMYFGANIAQRQVELKNGVDVNKYQYGLEDNSEVINNVTIEQGDKEKEA